MFVQTAHYIEKHKAQGKQMNLRAYGVEKTGATVRLAKMNLVLNKMSVAPLPTQTPITVILMIASVILIMLWQIRLSM